jgi:hypothetical protein
LDISYFIRTPVAQEVVDELCAELMDRCPEVSAVGLRLLEGDVRVLEMRVRPLVPIDQHVEWATLMAATESQFEQIEVVVPRLGSVQGELEGEWWPLVVDADLEVDGSPHVIEAAQRGTFGIGWDGGWIRSDDRDVVNRLLDLGALMVGHFTEIRVATDEARLVLAAPRTGPDVIQDIERLHAARRHLVNAVVTLDPRAGLLYEYQVEFVRALRDSWYVADRLELAERSLTAVQALLQLDAARVADKSRRHVGFLLFVVSVASGISVIFAAVDFVSTKTRPEVGDAIRLVVFALCGIVTLAAALYFRRSQSASIGGEDGLTA